MRHLLLKFLWVLGYFYEQFGRQNAHSSFLSLTQKMFENDRKEYIDHTKIQNISF